VWPPELEAALLEGANRSFSHPSDPSLTIRALGLENYQPDDSRETRLLGRFPMRNRFISDYIFQKTGKRRTAKQVGSRLQQLRDTCGGKRRK
jgi:transcriptional enhancer factor